MQAEALPFLRIMFLTSSGMLVFFMLGGALRSAGDARTPMVLGFVMTALNIAFNVVLIRGLGPIPSFRTAGAAMGTAIASGLVAAYAIVRLWRGGWVVRFPRGHGFGPDWGIIRELFRFGLPAGFQGIAMNIGGVFLLSFIGSLGPERGGAGGVRGVLHPALLVRDLDLHRAHGRGGRGGGTEPGRRPAGPDGGRGAHRGPDRRGRRGRAWGCSTSSSPDSSWPSSASTTRRCSPSAPACSGF